jgi:hypothetical protein
VTARRLLAASCAAAALAAAGCMVDARHDVSGDRRAFARLAKDTALVELEKVKPGSEGRLARAAGWAAFAEGGAGAFGGRQGDGLGVAHENATGVETYMTMSSPDTVPFRVVIVFDDAARFRAFVAHGGTLESAQPPGVEVYRLIDGALAPAAEIEGTSFAPDFDLGSSK